MITLKGKYGEAKVFTDNVEETAMSQIVNLLNQPFAEGSNVRIMPDCLTDDTEILTTKGFKLISCLTYDDFIASYIPDNGKIFFEHPKNIINRKLKDNEKVYSFSSTSLNSNVISTENHRNAMQKSMGIKTKDMPDITLNKDWVWGGNGLIKPDASNISLDNLLMLVWILGDGNIHMTDNKTSKNYRIRFGLKKERKINRVFELCKNLGIIPHVYTDKKQTTIYFNTEDSAFFVKILTPKKIMPEWFIFLSQEMSVFVLNEMLFVDGDYENFVNHQGFSLNTKKEYEANIISSMIAINYGTSKTLLRKTKGYGKEKVLIYKIKAIKNSALLKSKAGLNNRNIVKTEFLYAGNVVCVECSTGFFIARQNERSFVTGNCHAGAGCVIGFTANVTDKIIPDLVGVDLGCGVLVVDITGLDIHLDRIDDYIHNNIPSGHNNNDGELTDFKGYKNLLCYDNLRKQSEFGKAIGSLGSGNHYIELNEGGNGKHYLVIHSGSRNLGKQVAEYYQNEAVSYWKNGGMDYQEQRNKIISDLKEQKRGYDIPNALATHEKLFKAANPIYPANLCFLVGEKKQNYLEDMKICQSYASLNRFTMAKRILQSMNADISSRDFFETIHNYVNFDDGIMRKGAVSARAGEKLIIPMNMRDGSLLCIGKGNADWNFSAPHGAGRVMSRGEAKRNITMDEYRGTMNDVFTSSINESTLDEAPQAYKPMEEIIANIEPTVEILEQIKPIYNFKSSDD